MVFILILRNSVKSLQLILNEFAIETGSPLPITSGAFTKARKKLKHTAYVELNDNIVNIFYKDNKINRFRGFRILAFDGSRLTLPNNNEIKETFGSKAIRNHSDKDLGEYSGAVFQTCYDVLNNISIKSVLAHGSTFEADLVEKMLPCLNSDDLSLFDRGYVSYPFIARLIKQEKHFIMRCQRSSFNEMQKMFEEGAPESKIVTINVPNTHKKEIKHFDLPELVTVKLVRIVLSTGEVEVLVTSLLDSNLSIEDFNYLYSLRWGVETFFCRLKGRLGLENFTGKTVESIFQDFWSTIFISNLETIMTEDIEKQINVNKEKKKKINKAVSFNAIKNMVFKIFNAEKNIDDIIDKLDKLFIMNLVSVRPKREAPHREKSIVRSLNFQKRMRKHVF